ncbi:MAG: hypothetical protein ACYDG3_04635 [Bacillati bacterium]
MPFTTAIEQQVPYHAGEGRERRRGVDRNVPRESSLHYARERFRWHLGPSRRGRTLTTIARSATRRSPWVAIPPADQTPKG